jgi:uncharacterized membrane protein
VLNLYRAGVMEWTWFAAGLFCLAAAAWSASGRRFKWTDGAAARTCWGAAVPLLFVFFKLSQYRAHESMLDSAAMVNLAWNAAHGGGLVTAVFGGVSYWSVHFAFAYALLSPILWLWPSATPFFIIHALALASVPACAYLLARGADRRADLGWLAALLAVGNPLVCGVLGTVLDNSSFALPLFLWAAYFWETRRRKTALVFAVLMISTRETIPFLFAGLGAYAWTSATDFRGRRRAAAVVAAAAALWLFEVWIINRAKAASGFPFDYWALYPSLGGSRDAVLETMRRRPWMLPAALVWPPLKIWHAARTLLAFALLPLAAGAAALPMLAVWLPQQMGDVSTNFHLLVGHQGAYVAGPALWAAVRGLRRLDAAADANRRRLLASWVLVVAACGFFATARFRLPDGALPSSWDRVGPRAVAAIGPTDAVWSDYFFATHLAARRFIKVLPLRDDPNFERENFAPDSVLMSRHWLARADPATSARVLGAVKSGGLVPVFSEDDLVVFSRPR